MNEIDLGIKDGVRTIEVYDEKGNLIAIFKRVQNSNNE
jgi:hypothetical protein